MISVDGWLNWALRDPAPEDKVYAQRCAVLGFVPHSMEGIYRDARSRLFSRERDPQDPTRYSRFAAASWHFSNLADGRLIQHYSVFASCWTSGARLPNTKFNACENEGNQYQALTEPQVANLARLMRELAAFGHWTPRRPTSPTDMTATLYEHRECVRFGAEPTACPSGRIPWARLIGALNEEDDDMQLVWDAERSRLYLFGPKIMRWITSPDEARALEKLLGPAKVALAASEIDALGRGAAAGA